MKKIVFTLWFMFFGLIGVTCFSPSPVSAFPQNGARPFSELTFKLALAREQVVELEPVPLRLTLVNGTSNPVVGHSVLEFESGMVHLLVTDQMGNQREIKNLTLSRSRTAITEIPLESGFSTQQKEWLTLDLDQIFPFPGSYRLQAVLSNVEGTQVVYSNVAVLQVAAPTGQDREAYEYIKNFGDRSGSFFVGNLLPGETDQRDLLTRFAIRFPQSAYSAHAWYLLGVHSFYQQRYDLATEAFNRVTQSSNPMFEEEVQVYLKKIHQFSAGTTRLN